MGVDQLALRPGEVALVLAARGAAVGEEVLGRPGNATGGDRAVRRQFTLEAEGHRTGVALRHLGMLGIAFIGAAPAVILGYGQGRAEGPVGTGHGDFERSGFADAADQVGIARGTQADVVREDGRADDVVVPVDGVDAIDQRDLGTRPAGGRRAEVPGQLDPCLGCRTLIAAGRRVATCQDRSQRIGQQVLRRDCAEVGLNGLADLLFHGHAAHQLGDEGLGFGVRHGGGRGGARPQFRMRAVGVGYRRGRGRHIVDRRGTLRPARAGGGTHQRCERNGEAEDSLAALMDHRALLPGRVGEKADAAPQGCAGSSFRLSRNTIRSPGRGRRARHFTYAT